MDGVGEPLEIMAPMNGRVVCIHVVVGKPVQEGEAMISLEAMKAQVPIRAPRSGIVLEILTTEDSMVSAGEVLAALD